MKGLEAEEAYSKMQQVVRAGEASAMLQWLLQFLKWLLKPLPKLGISATLTVANT
jgi:hypothetical protein